MTKLDIVTTVVIIDGILGWKIQIEVHAYQGPDPIKVGPGAQFKEELKTFPTIYS